jgi:antitoxin component YwqK of YwqJK toxin-antitoxin module
MPSSQEQDSIEAWIKDSSDQSVQGEELPEADSIRTEALPGAQEGTTNLATDSESQTRSNREVIVQRYADGKPQIEREVIQDKDGNYLNDGFWRVYSPQGQRVILAQGQYQRGVMEGIWMRKHAKDSSGLFATKPFTLFDGPFVSIATFKNNRLDGIWTLQDKTNQKMFEVPYREGKRHGTASWWYPSQAKLREVTFVDGVINGRLREWDEQQKLIRDEDYIDGQRVIRNVTYYRPQQPETENYFLDAKLEVDGEDDWWRAEPAQLVAKGQRVQHGPVTFWYENGLPKMKGNYLQGDRGGRFTWWHSNGQKQLEGTFVKGLKAGRWRWWHANGMKASEGTYQDDQPSGVWTWWNEDGKVENQKDFGALDKSSSESVGSTEELPAGMFGNPQQTPAPILSPNSQKPDEPAKDESGDDASNAFSLDLDDIDPSRNRESNSPSPVEQPQAESSPDNSTVEPPGKTETDPGADGGDQP